MDHLLRKPEAGVLLGPSLHFFSSLRFTFYTASLLISFDNFCVIELLKVSRHNFGA